MNITIHQRQALLGSALVILGAIGFSTKSILIKLAYADSAPVDAITLMALRMLMALPFFLAVALSGREPRQTAHNGLDWSVLVLLGLLGYYMASFLDFSGLQYISAGLERLILFLYPTIVVLLTALLYRRPIGKAQGAALLLSYAGIALVYAHSPHQTSPHFHLGAALVFGSALTFAVFMVGSGHYIPRFGARRFTAYSMTIACLATIIHFAVERPLADLLVSQRVFYLAALLAVFSTVLPSFLVSAGIKRIGADNASIVGTVGPVATLGMAYFILGETLSGYQLAGSALVLAGVTVVSIAKRG